MTGRLQIGNRCLGLRQRLLAGGKAADVFKILLGRFLGSVEDTVQAQ